jgi:hypothetical protein
MRFPGFSQRLAAVCALFYFGPVLHAQTSNGPVTLKADHFDVTNFSNSATVTVTGVSGYADPKTAVASNNPAGFFFDFEYSTKLASGPTITANATVAIGVQTPQPFTDSKISGNNLILTPTPVFNFQPASSSVDEVFMDGIPGEGFFAPCSYEPSVSESTGRSCTLPQLTLTNIGGQNFAVLYVTLYVGKDETTVSLYFSTGPSDNLQLTNVQPDPTTSGYSSGSNTFTGHIKYSFASFSSGLVALRVYDAASGGNLLGSSDFVTARGSGGEGDFQVQFTADDNTPDPVYLQAVVINQATQTVALRTTPIAISRLPDVSIDHVEFVQVNQDAAAGASMIAGKPTMMRIFVKQKGETDNPFTGINAVVQAHACDEGEPTVAGIPFLLNSTNGILARAAPDRTQENQSLNFLLPDSWTKACYTMAFDVQLLLPPGRTEGPQDNNHGTFYTTFSTPFFEKHKLRIAVVDVCVNGVCPRQDAFDGNLQQYFMEEAYPLLFEEVDIVVTDKINWPPPPGDEILAALGGTPVTDLYQGAGRQLLLSYLDRMKPKDSSIVLGLIPDQPAMGDQSVPGGQAIGISSLQPDENGHYDPPFKTFFMQDSARPSTVAHEIAHLLGLQHTRTADSCGQQPGPSPWTSPTSQIGDPGYDVSAPADGSPLVSTFILPTTMDLMSYCNPRWLSAVNYKLIEKSLNSFEPFLSSPDYDAEPEPTPAVSRRHAPHVPARATRDRRPHDSSIALVTVSGLASSDGTTGTLLNTHPADANAFASVSHTAGGYCLNFFGGTSMLGQNCFDLAFQDVNDYPVATAYFSRTLALPAGVTRIALAYNGTELASLAAGGVPSVQFSSPNPGDTLQGTQTIQWSGSDSAGANLTYILDYSADGGQTWQTLQPSTTATSFSLDAGSIPGGTNGYFRLTASDGLGTASASVGPVTVAQRPQLAVAHPSLAFGSVQLGQSVVATFPVANAGDGLLALSNIQVDDPEFAASVILSPIPPGATGGLRVRFTPNSAGPKNGNLTFSTSDSSNLTYTVPLSGSAFVSATAASPTSLAFGNVTVNQVQTATLTVGTNGGGTVLVKSLLLTGSQAFSLVSPPSLPLAISSSGVPLKIAFTPTAAGPASGTLTMTTTDNAAPTLTVSLSGTGVAPAAPILSLVTSSLAFGSVNINTTSAPQAVTVKNTGNAAGTVTLSTAAPFSVSPTSVSVAANSTATANVTFTPTSAGAATGTLKATSGAQSIGTVSLTGTGLAATANLSLSPTSLNFQTVPVGTASSPQTVTVKNTGGAAGTVTLAAAAPFSVSPTSVSVAANSTASASVTFTPTSAGAAAGTLTATSGGQSIGTVSLTGTGAATQTGGGTGNIVMLRLDFGIYQKSSGSFANLTASYDTDNSTSHWMIGVGPQDATKPLLNGTGKSIDTPPGNFYFYFTEGVYNSDVRLTIGWQDGTTDVSYYQMAGDGGGVIPWPYEGGTTNATLAFITRTLPPVCKVAQAAATNNCSTDDILQVSIQGKTGSGTGTGTGTTTDVTLKVDGGTFNAETGVPSGGVTAYFVNRLTPPSYPATLKSVQIYFSSRSDGLPANTPITIFSGSNPSGSASIALSGSADRVSATIGPLNSFATYTVPARTITSGDFVVGFSVLNPPNIYPADQDQLTPSQKRSYASLDGVTFTLLDSIDPSLSGNLAIRAVATVGSGSGGTQPASACVAAPANLVGWWSGDGNAADLTGNFNGTAQGGTTYATGEVGQAFSFNGSSGYVSLGNPAGLNLTSGFTIAAWINPHAAPPTSSGTNMAAVLTKWAQNFNPTSDTDTYGLWLRNNSGALTMFAAIHQAGTSEPNIQGGSISLNTWTHVATTFDAASGQFVLYVNGQSVASVDSPGAIVSSSHAVYIGQEASTLPRPFNGLTDEVQVFSRALSAAELQTIVQAGSNGVCKNVR